MKFRPCIDIHNGKVKQIVGSTLRDEGDKAEENFVSDRDAAFYARLYREHDLPGGHVIMLNAAGSEYFDATREQALSALAEYPQGLAVGGGITADNAKEYIDAGASHVIVTSYVFRDGCVNDDNLAKLVSAVGKERITLDLSCRYIDGTYRIVTDRWQKVSDETVDAKLFDRLGRSCDDFLVHAVDSEGKASGLDERLIGILKESQRPVCYAGGIASYEDIRRLDMIGEGRVDFTVGSRLDIFGGNLKLEEIARCTR